MLSNPVVASLMRATGNMKNLPLSLSGLSFIMIDSGGWYNMKIGRTKKEIVE
jgi:hypothetical protein